ncbi:glycosyltransferase 61 family protein [Pannus brasiliensis CCIBt3594]|uniref:Glycosyltransferase 61 family protein n=1 Tax=Pannus brasiliensis CCIBt3594 TaxID=1427578 RepID=A0AAW9QWT6_9CHRO
MSQAEPRSFLPLTVRARNKILFFLCYWYSRYRKNRFVSAKTRVIFRRREIRSKVFRADAIQDPDNLLTTPGIEIDNRRIFASIAFSGYDRAAIAPYLAPIRVFEGSPLRESETWKNILYLPKYRCFYRSDGSRIDYSCIPEYKIAPKKIEPPKNPRELSGKLLYGGHLHRHYGHFITECIGRLWYAAKDRERSILYSETPNKNFRRDAIDRFMSLLDLDKSRFLHVQQPVMIDEIVIPYPSFIFGKEAFSVHRVLPESVARAVLDKMPEPTGQPLYLSRSKLDRTNSFRSIERELELEAILREKNFSIVHPETLSLEEQITLINKHEIIVGVWGSALHNVLFDISRKKKLVCLGDIDMPNRSFFLVDGIKKIDSVYISALEVGEDPALAKLNQTRKIDLDRAIAGLRSLDLV